MADRVTACLYGLPAIKGDHKGFPCNSFDKVKGDHKDRPYDSLD
jgi:hypothetical protein